MIVDEGGEDCGRGEVKGRRVDMVSLFFIEASKFSLILLNSQTLAKSCCLL